MRTLYRHAHIANVSSERSYKNIITTIFNATFLSTDLPLQLRSSFLMVKITIVVMEPVYIGTVTEGEGMGEVVKKKKKKKKRKGIQQQ